MSLPALVARCYAGGLLMGVANLVPGISGGAMLLLLGVYRRFLESMADLTTLRWGRVRSWVTVCTVAAGAGTTILLLAGAIKWLILNHRPEVFAVVIGMRLGAIPVVWRLARPATPALWAGFAGGVLVTALAAVFVYVPEARGALGLSGGWMMFVAALLGASATILPGLDGSYILILLGQYVPILGAIDTFADALKAGDLGAAFDAALVLAPVGVAVALGIGGVSVLMRHLLKKFPKPTYGVLLGILAGAFIGLYPFGEPRPPVPGDRVNGVEVTAETAPSIEKDDWPLRFWAPSLAQAGVALALIAAGFGAATLLAKFDPEEGPEDAEKNDGAGTPPPPPPTGTPAAGA